LKKPNLGQKQTCKKCEARFYDLNKNPAECPKCGETIKITKSKTKRAAPLPEEVAAETPAVVAAPIAADAPKNDSNDDDIDLDGIVSDDDDDDDELDDDPDDDDLMEDTSDIGEDKDDLSEVLDHVDDGVGDK